MSSLIALAIFLAITVLGQAGRDAAQIAKEEQEAAERKQAVPPQQRLELIRPLDCDFTATKVEMDGVMRTRCYIRKSK